MAILWESGVADADGERIISANRVARLLRNLTNAARQLRRISCGQAGSNDYEFVAAHARNAVVSAANLFQTIGKRAQQLVAIHMAKTIVDALEPVHVANEELQWAVFAAAA